ncbi:fungal-specific transcription factor domain-containing protein [Talaromyces proteolyticus]|uniref:Fungal-specific transcription factor domain-containing protein n=1 Tax=Talaromyces proteolyticus TaxID=1131652 RepID=A0AAD4PX93_9EURO|nr:fungal-specific transcription factor domain-containing protein [Talaromyces proteolyticus]KAH8692881.1 fungal-specific transcription factor domain-containing protein [Talaromyces proteolyticus]
MARRKVAPENRIRAAQACENCKRRKQKCNGTIPCSNCSKRQVQCLFWHPVPATGTTAVTSNAPPEQRDSKKRTLNKAQSSSATSRRLAQSTPDTAYRDQNISFSALDSTTLPNHVAPSGNPAHRSPAQRSQPPRDPFPVMSTANGSLPQVDQSGSSEEADEAELQGMSRMLNDGKGRMLYIGDSAPLSYLQTIRQLVSSVMGTSALTVDPHRHTILEASVQTPPTYQHTYTLPDREAGLFLVESFFVNTKGMLHLFDERSFKQRVERTYQNPLAAEQSWMCILYLVFAVGLQLRSASPRPSEKEAAILKRLLSDKLDRGEVFYLGARHLKDSASGIEDGDFASIQALLLMTLYMLSVGKRNTAWAYIGMAVRLSYALGLHRVETQRVYDESERTSLSVPRILLWRSLYVMDRFLAACLGRPTAIQDEEISEELFPSNEDIRTAPSLFDNFEFEALSASMRAAKILGTILHQIYRSRKVSLQIARNIAVSIHEWTQSLPEILQWRPTPIPHDDPGKAMGQLHLWMTYFSTIILLTRPFLLLHVKKVIAYQQRSKSQASPEAVANSPAESRVAGNPELHKYSAACVRSATHLIRAVQTIRVKGCLPRRDPFIINWMFIAALIVLTNSLFNVYENPENDSIAQIAVLLHQHFGECDPLAARYQQILNSFLKTISDYRYSASTPTKGYGQDPIENLFSGKSSMMLEMAQDQVTTDYANQPQPPMWNWATKLPSTDMLPDITAAGLTVNDLGDSVEGLVYPGSEELLGPDLGPIMEEVIHFDTLWPFNQDTGLYQGDIPMYGTSNYL